MLHSGVLLAVFWTLAALAILASLRSLWVGRQHLRAVIIGMAELEDPWTPPATLIVPVKGLDDGLRENLRSLLEQDYPDLEVLIVARDTGDPGAAAIRPLLAGRARFIAAGSGHDGTGEKINNLLAAVAAARPASAVIAFADSDGRVEADWLRGLIAPLRCPEVGAVTGYRWHFPEAPGFGALVRSVWNSTIAGGLGVGQAAFAWGGATALRRETFESARVAEFWHGAVSDDYRLTQAVRRAGLEIHYTPRSMVVTEDHCSAAEFFSWAVRQMIMTRVYAPRLWWTGFAGHLVYCGAMVASLIMIAAGRWWAAAVLAGILVLGMWRGRLRRWAAEVMFPGKRSWLRHYGWIYFWLTPLVTWIWLYTFLASAFTRRIEWRGNTYELLGPSRTCRVAES